MNLVYMARPVYGGWVTMTAHLSLTYEYPLFKITKRSEKSLRDYGYGVQYQNLFIDDLVKKDNLVITAIDKNYYMYHGLAEIGIIGVLVISCIIWM